jgi:hypothetical protein
LHRSKWLLVVVMLGAAVVFGRPLVQREVVVHAAVGQVAQLDVVLYSTAWCGYCRKAREFFAANGIRYVEYDIEKNRRHLANTGVRAVEAYP